MGVVCTAQKRNNLSNLTVIKQINDQEDVEFSQFRRERISVVGAIDGIPQMVFTNLPFQISNPSTKSYLANIEPSEKTDETLGMAIKCLSIIPKSMNEDIQNTCQDQKQANPRYKYSKTVFTRQNDKSKSISDYSIRQELDRELEVKSTKPQRNLTVLKIIHN
ncbi:hypothetical protein pb186bvf_002767 [Paramecium bursaria]